eukprot:218677-Amphidinium_carterae.1
MASHSGVSLRSRPVGQLDWFGCHLCQPLEALLARHRMPCPSAPSDFPTHPCLSFAFRAV